MTATPQRIRDRLVLPDAEIHYEVTGQGPPLVFAHGLGGNHMSWWQQVAYFSTRFTCVTFAHRGFTPSSGMVEGRAPEVFPDDLAALIEHLKLDDVVLVAQSMGGWSCLPYTLRNPTRVRGLVMACTAGASYRKIAGLDVPGLDRRDAWAAGELKRYEAAGIHPASGAAMLREQPAMHFLYREIDDLTPAAVKLVLRQRLMMAVPPPLAALAACRVPTLFLVGEQDVVFPPPVADALAKVMVHARVERFDAGHSIYFERPGAFNASVEQFLASLSTRH